MEVRDHLEQPCLLAVLMMMEYTCMSPVSQTYQSYHAGAIGSGRNTVIDYFESNWKANMTLNAAMKLGLEALVFK